MPGEAVLTKAPEDKFGATKSLAGKGKSANFPSFGGPEKLAEAGPPQPPGAAFPRESKDYRHPTHFPVIPRVEPVRGGAVPLSGFGGGRPGSAGAMGGAQGGGFGFGGLFQPFWQDFKMAPAAPAPGGGVASGATTVAPSVLAGGGAGPSMMQKVDRTTAKTYIPLDDSSRSYLPKISDGSTLYLAPSPPGLGTSLAGRGGDAKKRADAAFHDATVRAKDFAYYRANLATELMFEALARKQSVPLDVIRQAIERVKKGDGWTPQQDMPTRQLAITQDEARALLRLEQTMPKVPPLVVREYAAPRPGSNEAEVDSPDTVLWQPVIVLPSDGQAKIPFYLGNARGGYQVVIAGHTLDGRIGAVRGVVPVAQPESLKQTATPAPAAPIPPPKP